MIAQLAMAIAILSGPAGLTNDATPTFAISGDGTLECRVDDGAWTACADAYTAAELADGSHVFEVRSGAAKAHRSFTVDTAAPTLTLSASVDHGSATATFTASEDGAELACAVDAGTPRPCTSPWTVTGLGTGLHLLQVSATDGAGNRGEEATAVTIDVDPPDTTIDGPQGETKQRVLHYSLASTDPGATFECKLDDAAWSPCDRAYTTSELAPGPHRVLARAVRSAEEVDPTPASVDVDVKDCTTKVTIGVVEAIADCFTKDGDAFVTQGSVKVNGLVLNTLGGDSRFELNPVTRRVALGRVQLRLGSLVLYQGDLSWTVPAGDRFTLAEIDTRTKSLKGAKPDDSEQALDSSGADDANLQGLPVTGDAKLELVTGGKVVFTGLIELPGVLTDAEGNGLTGSVELEADNANGVHLSGAHVEAPLVMLGGVEIHHLYLDYVGVANSTAKKTCNQDSPGLRFDGGAEKIVLPTPNRLAITDVGFGIADGKFNYARGGLDFGTPGADIGAGIKVQKISISVCAGPPVKVEGRIGLTALNGKLAISDGGLIFTAGDPWSLRAEAPEATLQADRAYKFSDLFVKYTSSGAIDFGGDLKFAVGIKGDVPAGALDAALAVDAHAAGFIEGGRFNADLSATGCFAGKLTVGAAVPFAFDGLCTTVAGVVSSDGIAVCGSLKVGSTEVGAIGAGYRWGGAVQFMAGTCDLGPWRVTRSAAASAAGPKIAAIPRGRAVLVAVRGTTAAPHVTLHGPRGETVETSADGNAAVRTRRSVSFTNRALKTTYVVIAHPRPGRWRVTGDGIAEVRTAPMRRAPKVSASLRRGVLRYRVAPVAGQRVTFEEHGRGVSRTIATVKRSGRLRFRPADGAGGRRTITALIEQDGLPRRRITVARFKAPPRARPAKPRGVKIDAKARAAKAARGATITWRAAARAVRYGVTVELADGRRLFFLRDADDRVVRIPGGRPVAVRVVGLRADNGAGPAATTSGRTR